MKKRLAALLPVMLIAAASTGPLERIVNGQSASRVLADWCMAHRLPPLRAQRLSAQAIPEHDARLALRAARNTPIDYRRVRLACGGRTMSVADNWYLPVRLTSDMNRRLATTDTPFGLLVRPLVFRRRTLSAGWDRAGHFLVRAVLIDRAGAPFSYVIERYSPLPP